MPNSDIATTSQQLQQDMSPKTHDNDQILALNRPHTQNPAGDQIRAMVQIKIRP